MQFDTFFSRFHGSTFFRLLDKLALFCDRHRGIGSGGGCVVSGEEIVLEGLLRKCVSPKPVFFDIGANVGDYAQAIIAKQGNRQTGYQLHCFEPSAYTFEKLRQRFQDHPCITLNNAACGDRAGQATLFADKQGSGLASLTKRDLACFNIEMDKEEPVQIITVDDYCEEKGIGHIDFMKIDVEGHELDVLRGAERMLSEGTIDAIQFEFGGCNIDTKTYFKDFFVFFSARNFTLARISPSGYLQAIPLYREVDERFITTKFLAEKKC